MSLVNTTDATEADLEVLRDQLGRVPRGVVGIAARCVCGPHGRRNGSAPARRDSVSHALLPDPPGRRQGCIDA